MTTYALVISSYKYGHLAAHAIETALSQTIMFDKIMFVDDGANDCGHLVDLYSDNVEFVLRDTNLGVVDNFNDMLNRVSKYDYVMFMGADNWLRSDALYEIRKKMEQSANLNPKICVYDIAVTGELVLQIYGVYEHQMRPHEGEMYWDRSGGHHGSMMYHVKTAIELGGYQNNQTSVRTDEDLNLWNKFKNAGHQSIHLSLPLLFYRRHRENFNKY